MRNIFTLSLLFWCTLPYSFAESLPATLKVAVYDSPPFGFQHPDGAYGGLMVELWEDIAGELGWAYEYALTDMEGLLEGLEDGQYDVALGAISITPQRESRVDFTQAVNPSGTGIAVAASRSRSSFRMYWKPILLSLLELLGVLLLMLLLSALIVWWVEKRAGTGQGTERKITGLTDALWWSAVTMTTVGYGDKIPSSRWGKLLGVVWIFVGIIMVSLFTANASSILTTAKQEAHIQTVDDLRRVKVGAVEKSSGAEFLRREHLTFTTYSDIEAAADALAADEIHCIVSNVPVMRYINNSSHYGQLAISPQFLVRNNMGIALQDDSPLRESIDNLLLRKIAEPHWQQAVYRYLGAE